ncbi:MAG: hypothetical protein Q8Q52_02305 [Acidimicrobiia bacterium]|nr:hypothetical protein [Acidimicrobiia bacterium]
MTKTNAEIRAQGEHHVITELRRRGIKHRLEPRARRIDIVIPSGRGNLTVQVRVTSLGQRNGWLLTEEHERAMDDRLMYAFVDTEPAVPETFFIPGAVVGDVLRTSHRAWLATPGRGGRPHRDNPMRMIRSDYRFLVQGYPAEWLEKYRERWELLETRSTISDR